MALSVPDLTYVRELVQRRAAIVLEPSKQYLVESRLEPLAREGGFATIGELVAAMRARNDEVLKTRVVEALATNETTFFRDQHPFDALRDHIVPALVQARAATRSIAIWSAACSTGQEPYSIAMTLQAMAPLAGWKIEIVATDLSTSTLERAKKGLYRQIDVSRGLPPRLLATHFEKDGICFRIGSGLREAVTFRQMNLAETFPVLPRFDIVFLRNVLIYFDSATRARVLEQTHATMASDGYLLMGSSESAAIGGCTFASTRIGKAIVYRPRHESSGVFANGPSSSRTANGAAGRPIGSGGR